MRMAKTPKKTPKNEDEQTPKKTPKPKQTKKVKPVTELAISTATDTSTPTHDREKAIELFNKGVAFHNAEDIEKAEEAYLGSIEADPSYLNAYNNLGAITTDIEEKIEYYKKAILQDPLFKTAIDNLSIIYNNKGDEESKKLAREVQKNYDDALRKSINKNIDDHKNTQEKIDQLTTNIKKLEQNTDVEILTANLAASDQALKDILQDKSEIKIILEDKANLLTDEKNKTLAKYFEEKTKELETEKIAFEEKFKEMIYLSIIVLITATMITLVLSTGKPLQEIALQGLVTTSPIMILLLWLTKYYNRRLHETIHLIEEYKHKSIVLYSFTAYSAQLKILGGDDKTPLLDYTQKVSTTINQSPTHALTRKKTDKIPTGEIVELLNAMHPLRYNNNNSNNGKTG